VLFDDGRYLIVADERTFGAVPGSQQSFLDVGFVHGPERHFHRKASRRFLYPQPAPHRVEHRVPEPAFVRVLHPHIDNLR